MNEVIVATTFFEKLINSNIFHMILDNWWLFLLILFFTVPKFKGMVTSFISAKLKKIVQDANKDGAIKLTHEIEELRKEFNTVTAELAKELKSNTQMTLEALANTILHDCNRIMRGDALETHELVHLNNRYKLYTDKGGNGIVDLEYNEAIKKLEKNKDKNNHDHN